MLNHQPRSGWTRGVTMPNLSDDDYMLPYGKRYRTMPDTLPERHISARDILSGVLPTKPRQETISGETRRIASSILYQTLCMGAATNFKPSRLLNIGHPEYTPKPNISSRATAFAKANDVLSPNQDDRGSMRGAFRHGLFVSKQNTDGTYDVKKEKISSETFNRYLDVLNSLDENGNPK